MSIELVYSGVLILEIKQEDGEEVYDTVTDDAEAERVFNKFQEEYGSDDEEDEESSSSGTYKVHCPYCQGLVSRAFTKCPWCGKTFVIV